jgi:hypothetical protein
LNCERSRCEELKKYFPGLPAEDMLMVDYSCALQKERTPLSNLSRDLNLITVISLPPPDPDMRMNPVQMNCVTKISIIDWSGSEYSLYSYVVTQNSWKIFLSVDQNKEKEHSFKLNLAVRLCFISSSGVFWVPGYSSPWTAVRHNQLPMLLRQHFHLGNCCHHPLERCKYLHLAICLPLSSFLSCSAFVPFILKDRGRGYVVC